MLMIWGRQPGVTVGEGGGGGGRGVSRHCPFLKLADFDFWTEASLLWLLVSAARSLLLSVLCRPLSLFVSLFLSLSPPPCYLSFSVSFHI